MSGCCDNDCGLKALQQRQRGTLRAVLAINAVMFVVILAAAFYGRSSALLADSLDNLGDALTYGLNIAANLAVFVAAGGVWLTGSGWPDIAVALGLVALLLRSAVRVLSSAWVELRRAHGLSRF